MKKVIYISLVFIVLVIYACTKDNEITSISSTENIEEIEMFTPEFDTILLQEDLRKLSEKDRLVTGELKAFGPTFYKSTPIKGICGSTRYLFLVYDNNAYEDIQVKLYLPNDITHYQNMHRWKGYQYVYINIWVCGDVDWRYVKKSNRKGLIFSQGLPNTGVDIRTYATSKLGWMFKSDGSSWQLKNDWRNVLGSPAHTGNDIHAQDWNWKWGNQDIGKKLNAPLCGEVVFAGWYNNCYGNTVEILHKTGRKRVKFRVSHLDEVYVKKGDLATRNTILGTLGDSGSSTCNFGPWSAHAHCVLYELDSNNRVIKPLKFSFSY